jgi:hypothetical protein
VEDIHVFLRPLQQLERAKPLPSRQRLLVELRPAQAELLETPPALVCCVLRTVAMPVAANQVQAVSPALVVLAPPPAQVT